MSESALTVRHILQTATMDIQHWWANQSIRDDRAAARRAGMGRPTATTYKMSFLPKHVQRCVKESDLLERAIKDRANGASYKQGSATRLLYEDLDKLKAAHEIALKAGR